ncbi:AAA family ATPase [Bradyrhizobium diazoefficiens]|nr:ATP-binding protein [Bradyrhizobium diazoefficiens]QLD45905.1 ATP-binding protein [Bradyrhizobium diazoefficiens]WLA72239.1 ATP-binding protein [Bradyrhizobium diazoefficiens]BCE19819.1 hypothetical protein XF1B_25000 [Bradyrhizobium diazoefficiens]BCE46072.1 hypothetical protein XF4B_24210 [Bradyrhizobium diazoefficiens]BCE89597.1 hypothetical protein XF10B_23950 [Bradyrhizobium diazoefficiens]
MSIRGKIWSAFNDIRIFNDRLLDAHDIFDDLRQVTRESPQEPKRCATIFAPTHSGKSMCVKTYLETRVVDEAIKRGLFPKDMKRNEIASKQRIVIYITLEGVTTIKNLAEEILRALNVEAEGNTQQLLKLCYDHIVALGVELIIVDEVQHLRPTKQRSKYAEKNENDAGIANTLKVMLIRGVCPMVFIGVTEARTLLFGDDQLDGRVLEEISFDRLDYGVAAQREMFIEYLGMLGLKLKEHGLFEEESNLLDGDIPECLHVVSGGRVGYVSRIVEQAAVIAAKAGSPCVLRSHLEAAVDKWAIPRLIDYNPFPTGVRKAELK